jgi:uncharacterized protein (TIGR02266 family)
MAGDDAGGAMASRSKVVRLKLRYATPTVEKFIEKYALDVSPRGIHVNIAKPLAVGTRVKLEIRLANEQVVIQGAGSVVGNRDGAQASGTRPAGLWIKFIKIDEPSKAFIDNLVSARPGAGLAYEEHEETEKAEDVALGGSPAQSPHEAPAVPVPPARSIRATLVGIMAPATLPARPRLPSLPPGPLPPPAKAWSVPPPPDSAPGEQGEMEDVTVVWDGEPSHEAVSALPAKAPSPREATSMGVAPAPSARPRLPSLPPPRAPPPKVPSARPPVQWDQDSEEDTVIWDREPSHQEVSASPASAASPRKATLSGVTALAMPVRPTGTSLPPPVTRSADERSTDATRTPPTQGARPADDGGIRPRGRRGRGDLGRGRHDFRRDGSLAGRPAGGSSRGRRTGRDDARRGGWSTSDDGRLVAGDRHPH